MGLRGEPGPFKGPGWGRFSELTSANGSGVGRPDSPAGEAPDVWGRVRAGPPAEGTAKCQGPAAGS